jgi:hypothetical protein
MYLTDLSATMVNVSLYRLAIMVGFEQKCGYRSLNFHVTRN